MKNRFHRLKEIFNSKIGSKIRHKKVFWGSIAGCTGLAVILAGGFFLKAKGASKDQAETTVQSAEAKTGTISTTVEGTGSVSNGATTDVVVPTGIKVKEVLVESGDTVEEGQVLATLDEASIASELLEVKENMESVEEEIDDLSSDAQTEGTTEYLEAKVLNGELEELQEAETTLTSLLETQTITATCAGTVSSINVEADTEITKSSGSSGSSSTGNSSTGNSSTGNSSTGNSSSGSSASVGTTDVSTGAATDGTSNSASESTSSSESTSGSGSTSSDTSTTGSYSLMYLSAQTGSSAVYTTAAADNTSTQSAQNSEGTAVQTAEVSTTNTVEKITSVDLDVTAPKTGAKPQDTIKETDQYTGMISWNCSSETFESGTSYTADIRLTAKDGYVFSAKILPEIKGADVTFEVTENDAGQSVLRIKAKFSKTSSKIENSNNSNNNSNNNNSNSSGNTTGSGGSSGTTGSGSGTSGVAGAAGSVSGTTGSTSGTGGNTSGESGNESGSSGSAGSSSSGTSTGESGATEDSGSTVTSQYSAYETAAFSIASNDQATVSINVDELDITSVKTGQTAKITLDAIEGEEFEGTITSVSSEASSGSSSAKYPVEITFDKTDDMRIGMTASASISIDEAEDAVLIPVDALQEKGGKTFVYTKKDSDGNLSGEVEVETGLSNGNKVEITSGLESGDTVYYLKTTSSSSSNSQQDMQGGPGGNGGEAPTDMGGSGGPGGDGGEAPTDMGGSGGPGGQSGNSSN